MIRKYAVKLLANFLFLGVFGYLLFTQSSWGTIRDTASLLPASNLFGGLALIALTYLLRTQRFYLLLNQHNLPWHSVLRVMLQHNAINNLVPFRLGELSFPLLLKRNVNVPYTESAKVLITARLFDLIIMMLIGGAVALLILHSINARWALLALISGIFLCLLGGLFVKFASRKGHELIRQYFGYLQQHLLAGSALTFVIWVLKLLGLSLLLAPMLNTQAMYALLAVIVVEGTAILPINGPANFGSLEGAVVAALLPFGLEAHAVFSAVLNLHIAIIMLAALGYLLSLFISNQQPHKA